MPEVLRTTDQLKQLFAEYPRLGTALADANANIARINELNKSGGGNNEDEASKQYHATVDKGMPPVEDMLTLLNTLVSRLGVDGDDVMKVFDKAEDEAKRFAADWKAATGQ
ncbi:hypothetical protein ACFUCQ_18550 [Streptomyces sp. NPDC057197]|uniref:hypothetical protein n=1 Tax=unclassified Streptomyces TaxID=2593676 RepID=UPI0013319CF7|nr:hypothetical protein [Streptomyces sp. SAT1]